jgi:hypothetical protein
MSPLRKKLRKLLEEQMKFRCTCFLLIFLALALNANATGPTVVNLGAASSFGVLGASGVTSADAGTTIAGDVGSCPAAGAAITGLLQNTNVLTPFTLYPDCIALGPPALAQASLTAAYLDAKNRTGCTPIIGGAFATVTLPPGLYCASSALLLTGTLTLQGAPGDVWIFQIGSMLTSAIGSSVVLEGVGGSPPPSACDVFWQVTSSATIQTGVPFVGTIMALTSITLDGGTLNGRALARNALVSISSKETIINGCSGGVSTVPTVVLSPVNSSIICSTPGSSVTKTAVVLLNGVPVVGASVTFTVTAGPDIGQSGTVTTDASGVATFTFTGPFSITSTLGDTIVATINSGTVSSNTTFVTCSGSPADVCASAPPPTVSVLAVTTGPPKEVIFSILAPGGLVSLVADLATNATVTIPSFDHGTTLAVGVTAIKIKQSLSSVVELTATDVCGNITVFDPVFATITIPAYKTQHAGEHNFRHREVDRFNGIGHTEGIVLLQNDTPGVTSLVIRVNGSLFRTNLSDGQTKKIDISSALIHGSNTVTIVAFGKPNSSVDLSISDGK